MSVNDFRRNPLDFAAYAKPKKAIKAEFEFQRLKEAFDINKLSLSDYLYAVGAKITVVDYIPEWLEPDLIDLNNAVNDCSIEEISDYAGARGNWRDLEDTTDLI